jgi:uncharacterized protein (DUF2141 family)
MKKSCLIIIGLLSISVTLFSQFKLEIEVTGIKNSTGKIMLQLMDSGEKTVSEKMSEIKVQKCTILIENLKPGKYAVRYFHDENLNGEMDTNFMGIPTEGYGFSNNAKGSFGPPPFEKWLFEVSADKKIILSPTY